MTTPSISAALTAWRHHFGITQSEAAAYFDVPIRTYEGWEAGRPVARPRILLLAIMAGHPRDARPSDAPRVPYCPPDLRP